MKKPIFRSDPYIAIRNAYEATEMVLAGQAVAAGAAIGSQTFTFTTDYVIDGFLFPAALAAIAGLAVNSLSVGGDPINLGPLAVASADESDSRFIGADLPYYYFPLNREVKTTPGLIITFNGVVAPAGGITPAIKIYGYRQDRIGYKSAVPGGGETGWCGCKDGGSLDDELKAAAEGWVRATLPSLPYNPLVPSSVMRTLK